MWYVLVEWWDVVCSSGMVGWLKTGSLPQKHCEMLFQNAYAVKS